ncbi:MAG: tetratricopeptide repeat protein [Candidatus Kapabacteria bacterium]|nr:tetratricopeptide repeat protein [Candidatus Kapabacteria bacterium]
MKKKKQATDEGKIFKIAIIILIAVPLIVFFQATNFSFVWDDLPLYINHNHFPAQNPFQNIFSFFVPKSNEMYIPLTYLFWAISSFFSGSEFNPMIFHFFNLLIHILNGLLVFLILRLIFKEQLLSLFGALLFSIHPIQVEAVAWVSELRGLLSALFGFLGTYFYLLYHQKNFIFEQNPKNPKTDIIDKFKPNTKILIFVGIFLILSVLSKPSGVVFPFIIFLLDIMLIRHNIIETLKRTWVFIVVIIPVFILTLFSETESKIDLSVNILARPLIFLDSIGFYIKQIIYPLDLAVNYGRTPSFVLDNILSLIIHIVLAVSLFLIFLFKQNKKLLYGYLIFIVGFLPVSGLVTFYYQLFSTVADRYIYFSMLGVSIIFVGLISEIKKLNTRNIFSGTYLFILIIVTFSQLPVWKDEISLWNNTIKKYPEVSAYSYFARGSALMDSDKNQEAILDFTMAIRLDSTLELAYYNRGNIYFDIRNFAAAINDYSSTLKLNPKNLNALINRGLSYIEINMFDKAITDFSLALDIDSTKSDVYVNRGIAYANQGNMESAIKDFQNALRLNPNDEFAKENLKMALESKNK